MAEQCDICDAPVLLLLGEYYEITDLSIKKSPRHIIATLMPHSCKPDAKEIVVGRVDDPWRGKR